ncbi:hypothetical protein BC831DRAFT_551901 [Entophlyctis helioformis]|nr:hypothetical protein BC831DRAFT_551901 [Entophlyctis helioformis]
MASTVIVLQSDPQASPAAQPPPRLSVTSSRLVHQHTLTTLRLVSTVHVLAFTLYYAIPDGAEYYRYMTNLSWAGMALYLIIASGLSLVATISPHSQPSAWLSAVCSTLFSLSYALSWIVSIIFWTLLVNLFDKASTSDAAFRLVNCHALNFVIMQVELWTNSIRVPFAHIGLLLAVLVAYTGWVYLLRYAGGVGWPYGFFVFLDIKERPLVAVGGIVVFVIIFSAVFTFAWLEARFRDRVLDALVAKRLKREAQAIMAKDKTQQAPSAQDGPSGVVRSSSMTVNE